MLDWKTGHVEFGSPFKKEAGVYGVYRWSKFTEHNKKYFLQI